MTSFLEVVATKYQIVGRGVVTTETLRAEAKRMLSKYFPEFKDIPMPRFKIVNHTNPTWLGLCQYKYSEPTTTISIQQLVLGDEESWKSTLAHELIHHVDFVLNKKDLNTKLSPVELRMRKRNENNGHGPFFMKYAEHINSIEGKDYVTVKSDKSIITPTEKDFYLLIKKVADTRFAISNAIRLSTQQKEFLKRKLEDPIYKLVLTNDRTWLYKGYGIGNKSGVPNDPDLNKKLKDIFENGKEVKI